MVRSAKFSFFTVEISDKAFIMVFEKSGSGDISPMSIIYYNLSSAAFEVADKGFFGKYFIRG